MKRPTHIAVVWWLDAWEGQPDKRMTRGYERVTTGFLLADNEHGITLADTYDPPDPDVERTTFIPRGIVQRVLRWRVRWQRNRPRKTN